MATVACGSMLVSSLYASARSFAPRPAGAAVTAKLPTLSVRTRAKQRKRPPEHAPLLGASAESALSASSSALADSLLVAPHARSPTPSTVNAKIDFAKLIFIASSKGGAHARSARRRLHFFAPKA